MTLRAAENARLLTNCTLFGSMQAADRLAIAAKAQTRRVAAGQPIFRIGDAGDSLMAIVSGAVRISLPAINGRDIILADLRAGEIFGEIAVLDGLGRSADATALGDTELLVLTRREVLSFLAARPEICLRLLALVSGRLRLADERMADLASVELRVRLAKAILRRAHGDQPEIAMSQGDLAGLIVGSREAVNRQLAAWQRAGLVQLRDGTISVQRPSELAAIAGLI